MPAQRPPRRPGRQLLQPLWRRSSTVCCDVLEEQGGRLFTQDVDTQRYVAGLRGPLGTDWNWEFSATYGRNDTDRPDGGRLPRRPAAVSRSVPPASTRPAASSAAAAIPRQASCRPPTSSPAACRSICSAGQGPDGTGTITPGTTRLRDEPVDRRRLQRAADLRAACSAATGVAIRARPIRWAAGAHLPRRIGGQCARSRQDLGCDGWRTRDQPDEGGGSPPTEAYVETVLPLLAGLPAAEDAQPHRRRAFVGVLDLRVRSRLTRVA